MKTYKQFFIKTLIIFLACMVIIPTGLILLGNHFIGKYVYSKAAAHINYWIVKKNAHAQELTTRGNKIVFLSGSNTHYGFNSKYASEVTGLPVLNYGLHVDLGDYAFDEAKKILKSGDIVVMPLEFNYYSEESEGMLPSPFAEYIISYDNNYYKKETFFRKLGLAIFFVQYWVTHPILISQNDLIEDDYKIQLNDFGDFIGNVGTSEQFSATGKDLLIVENIPNSYNKFALYKFIQYCKNNNIKVYATMPNIYHPSDFSVAEINAFNKIKDFYVEQDVKFIGDINSGRFVDKNEMHDTSYHLNQMGVKLRTEWIIKNILSINEFKGINNDK